MRQTIVREFAFTEEEIVKAVREYYHITDRATQWRWRELHSKEQLVLVERDTKEFNCGEDQTVTVSTDSSSPDNAGV